MALPPPTTDDSAAHPDGPRACDRCGRPLEAFVLELPMGLGSRTVAGECACEQQRRAGEARERARAAHLERVRVLLRQSGIGRRHEDASFESFVTTPATAAVVGVCRAFVAAFPEGGRGLSLAGPAGTGKTHLAVAVTRALIDRGVSAVVANVPMLLLTSGARSAAITQRASTRCSTCSAAASTWCWTTSGASARPNGLGRRSISS